MKPVDYSKTQIHGDAMAQHRAVSAMEGGSPLKKRGPVELEAQFYNMGMDRALKLGELGLQKEMFEKNLAEDKRQFDIRTGENQRQFGINLDFARDKQKYIRRQNNKAELLGMVNIGIGLGFGYLEYKANRRQIEMNKMMIAIMKGRQK